MNMVKQIFVFVFIVALASLSFNIFVYGKNNSNLITGFAIEGQDINISQNSFTEVDNYASVNGSHWRHMPLTYAYDNVSNCYPLRLTRINDAMDEIERLTNSKVSFIETNQTPDIIYQCTRTSNIQEEFETLGEVLLHEEGNIIISANISLYGGIDPDCSPFPNTEIHELLHAFGVEHNDRAYSIMAPYATCFKRAKLRLDVDQIIFDELTRTYS